MGEAIRHPREQCLERGKKQQAIALGRPGWSLRRIQKTRTKIIYYPTLEKQSNIICGSRRVRYIRAALLVRPKR
jgi:hypothetical protein